MDPFKVAITAMVATGIGAGPRDAEGRRRQFTAEELDALADFRLPGARLVGRFRAGVAAIQSRASRPASDRVQPTALPPAEPARA
jgi:hypothetical protein